METFAEKWFVNFPIPLYFISIILHSMGLHVLVSLRGARTCQDTILMSLSISEIFMSICDLAQNTLSRFTFHTNEPINYLTIVQCTLFVIPSFLTIIVLNIDRFLAVRLNIKYTLYITKFKTRMQLFACWSIGVTSLVIITSLRATMYPKIAHIIFKYIFPAIEGVVLLTGTFSYSYIYKKTRENRRRNSSVHNVHIPNLGPSDTEPSNSRSSKPRPSIARPSKARPSIARQNITRRRRILFAPFFILLTFFTFAVIPDIVNLMIFYVYPKVGTNLHANILLTFYVVGFISDALIYMFLQRHIRTRLKRIFFRVQTEVRQSRLSVISLGPI